MSPMSSRELDTSVVPLTRKQYDALTLGGHFDDHEGYRLELLDGQLVMTANEISPSHGSTCRRISRLLYDSIPAAVGEIGVADPVGISDLSEPEPDLWVAVPDAGYAVDHPTSALLVIEVSLSSRRRDLGLKARLYGQAGMADYWVVDLVNHALIVHRDPGPDGYTNVQIHREGTISPLAFPDLVWALDDILGPSPGPTST